MAHENSAQMDETRLKLGNASDQATIDISSAYYSLVATMVVFYANRKANSSKTKAIMLQKADLILERI